MNFGAIIKWQGRIKIDTGLIVARMLLLAKNTLVMPCAGYSTPRAYYRWLL